MDRSGHSRPCNRYRSSRGQRKDGEGGSATVMKPLSTGRGMHYTHIAYNLGVGGECGPSRGEGRGTKEGGADGTKQQKCGKRKGHGQATPAMPTDL